MERGEFAPSSLERGQGVYEVFEVSPYRINDKKIIRPMICHTD
jgi:hypothetical protein